MNDFEVEKVTEVVEGNKEIKSDFQIEDESFRVKKKTMPRILRARKKFIDEENRRFLHLFLPTIEVMDDEQRKIFRANVRKIIEKVKSENFDEKAKIKNKSKSRKKLVKN